MVTGRGASVLEDLAVVLVVLLLGGEVRAPEEEELGPVEADRVAAVREEARDLLDELDVPGEPDGDAVLGAGGEVARAEEVLLDQPVPLAGRLVVGPLARGRVDDDDAAAPVDDDPVAPVHERGDPADAHHRRDLQRARHDRGVRRLGAGVGDERRHLAARGGGARCRPARGRGRR